jgi:signal peptidase I
MKPTLDEGQRVLVNRLDYHFGDPGVGDVVVFHPPKGADRNACGVQKGADEACPEPTEDMSESNFIKRIVAGPGDELYIKDGEAFVNGEALDEPYLRSCGADPICNLGEPITIPEDHYFMMGDNRGASDDSRIWGPVPRDWIIGKAFFTYWPPSRFGIL